MPLLPARHYISDHERFLQELREKNPDLPQSQRDARAIWWDKDPGDLELQRQMDAGRVPMRPYVYQTE
jgi:hypothetical protein